MHETRRVTEGEARRSCAVGRAGQSGDRRAMILPPSPRPDHPMKQAEDVATQNLAGGPEVGWASREPSGGWLRGLPLPTRVQAGGPAAAQPTALPEPCPAQFPWAWDVPRKTVGPQLSQAGRAPTRGSHPKVYQHGGGWGGVRCRSHTGPCRTHALRTSSEPRRACVQRVCHSPPDRLRASNRHTY